MPITKAEASRLARRTGMKQEEFSVMNDGVLTLAQQRETRACVFLLTDSADLNAEGMCSVYEIRPKGCQTYPYVLNQRPCRFGRRLPAPFPVPLRHPKAWTWSCSILRSASCVKDQRLRLRWTRSTCTD